MVVWPLAAGVLFCAGPGGPTLPHPIGSAGQLVGVRIELEGRPARLLPAQDGTGRLYFEALRGRAYSVTLANRSDRRLGVELRVDGLNAISGERDPEGERGRLYVLPPWSDTTIRGWRTSLEEVRRFEFVDEASSYAARSSKWNPKLGWIEVAAYRERAARPAVRALGDAPGPRARGEAAEPSPGEAAGAGSEDRASRAHPGTGWGRPLDDPAVRVRFDPESEPAERIALRYEYAPALRALGLLPPDWDRLAERERGVVGFAQPPDR